MSAPPENVRMKSVYDPAETGDGVRVLVTQYWPRGVPKEAVDEYVRVLGPSRELLHAYKHEGLDWETCRARYLYEMAREAARHEISRLAEMARAGHVTLLCVCREQTHCHRTLLRELVLAEAES